MERKVQELLSEDKLTSTLKACMHHLLWKLEKNKPSPVAEEELYKKLMLLVKDTLEEGRIEGRNPLSNLGMIIEEFTSALAPIIVSLAATAPEVLREASQISEESIILLRRGVEDSLLEMIMLSLKDKILAEHLRYTEFSLKFERGKK